MPTLDAFVESNEFHCLCSEFLATALAVFLYGWSAAVSKDDVVTMALQSGLITVIVLSIFGLTSGGHANPLVTLTAWLMGKLSQALTACYLVGQFLGAYAGYYLLGYAFPEMMSELSEKTLSKIEGMPEAGALLLEFILTLLIILGFCATWDQRATLYRGHSYLAISLLKSMCVFTAFRVTGASFNLAQTLAVCMYHGDFTSCWHFVGVYICTPFVARVIWEVFLSPPKCN